MMWIPTLSFNLINAQEKCFDKTPFYYEDTIYYVDSISRQAHSFATEHAFDKNSAKVIASDLDANKF